ncbi:MAG: DUF1343 domain-containing protein [Epsilonproteobacteria bacterium]|nr:MAG: DUF1343 domain-containing protein [Campylobacterota bacterium]
MTLVTTGLERLIQEKDLQKKIMGKVAYLGHSASVDRNYTIGVYHLKNIFKDRLIKFLGPQHGLFSNVQDNMVETKDFVHPYFKLPVLSLYSEIRAPNDETLKDVDTLVIDLQDVGTRVYTYISTLGLIMEQCQGKDIKIVILDRPNPVGGEIIEGNILEEKFKSFVGHARIPMRHALTMGEVALYFKKYLYPKVKLEVIPMKGWKRNQFFKDTGLPWVNPSPNLPTMDSALTFVGTVLFEGTNISEGRGTTRSLEIVGHPKIEPFSLLDKMKGDFKDWQLEGFTLRPMYFRPTFQKHQDSSCGGFQIHVTNHQKFRPWRLGQYFLKKFRQELGEDFQWNKNPYEYEFEKISIDLINGSDKIRKWVESDFGPKELSELENKDRLTYEKLRSAILLYP